MAAYATPADMMLRFDRGDIGQLCSDDKNIVSPQDLPNNPVCLTALQDAAGEIEAALLVSNRYSVADLQALTGNSLSVLVSMNCLVAMRRLTDRRFGWNPEKSKAIREASDTQLEKLRKGENTFNIQAAMDAGEPVVDGPTMAQFDSIGLIRDNINNFFVPRRIPRPIN